MIRNVALVWAAVIASHLCAALPFADPEPNPIHRTHVRIHIPHEVHTVHHHHVEKVPILHEVPVIKEVPVVHTVPIVKHVPVVNTVHVPIINTQIVEKPVLVPYKEHLSLWH
ncbi:uncharacterized protein LOC121737318 [Aricia agestis]|uniref:uncharacterized protein LOC121737318 n=1 Tax=Aricia agestis TaxID=91739 RepID=UPI001C20A476|nr:uncharacterized protein LOC121737318 [Aricia agestis]